MASFVELNRNNTQSVSDVKHQIVLALRTEYNEEAANAAMRHIEEEVEELENLLDDLEGGAENSYLVDVIIKDSGVDPKDAPAVLALLITAVNGDYHVKPSYITSLQQIFSGIDLELDVELDSHSASASKTEKEQANKKEMEQEKKAAKREQSQQQMEQTKQWLVRQWDHTFDSFSQNKDLLKLFAIGHKQQMPHLPGVLHQIYSQWRINYLIDQKNKKKGGGKLSVHPVFDEFVNKSEAFKHLSASNKQLVKSAINTYGARFSPQPTLPYYAIHDDLYIFVLYTYLMSEAIHNLIKTDSITLPLQLDFWIIPKHVEDTITAHSAHDDDDDDDTDDDDDDDDKEQKEEQPAKNGIRDACLFNVEQRLQLDTDIKYSKFAVSEQEQAQSARIQRKLQESIASTLQHRRSASHNRLVCIADRRTQFYDLKVVQEAEHKETEKDNDDGDGVPVITVDDSKLNSKQEDEFYVFQPPGNYGQFPHAYSQEHLQYLSREYMLPSTKVRHPESGHVSAMHGVYNDFSHQMFTISFCCHSADDIKIQWFVNGRNIRITSLHNFTKIWPEFFEASQRTDSLLARIQADILSRWKLPLRNEEYAQFERDLLRGVPSSTPPSPSSSAQHL